MDLYPRVVDAETDAMAWDIPCDGGLATVGLDAQGSLSVCVPGGPSLHTEEDDPAEVVVLLLRLCGRTRRLVCPDGQCVLLVAGDRLDVGALLCVERMHRRGIHHYCEGPCASA